MTEDGHIVIARDRSAAVEAALERSAPDSSRVVPRHELGALLDLGPEELPRRFHGLRVVPDLTRRVVDLGASPPAGYLRDGWLWVDGALLEALESDGSRRDTGRALVRHAALRAAHPDWDAARVAEDAPLPDAPDLDGLRSRGTLPTQSHPFAPFCDANGRWGLRTPEYGDRPAPAVVASVVEVIADDGDSYLRGAGTIVGVDQDAIWIVTARHLLPENAPVGAVIAGEGYPATVVVPEPRALARALARERRVLGGSRALAGAARTLDLALLRIETRAYTGPVLSPVPLAAPLTRQTPVVTVGYSTHPQIEPVVIDLFGSPGADVVVVSAGTMDPGLRHLTGPMINLPTPVTAREAGGGQGAVVCDDPWMTAGMSGGPMLVATSGDAAGDGPGHALAGVTLALGDAGELGRVALVTDAAAVRALIRATRSFRATAETRAT